MLSEEQRALRDAVRGVLSHTGDPWPRLREIGVAGLAIPERYGGAGAGAAETGVVMEELGRTLTPSPMLGSAVLAGQALLASGDDAACRRLLPSIADGSMVAALAWATAAGRWDLDDVAFVGRLAGRGGWELDGEAHYVLDGDVADVLLVAARTPDGIGLFEVDPGQASCRPCATMDGSRPLAVVRLTRARGRRCGGDTGGDAGGDASGALRRARDLACIALGAEQVGAAGRALELTVEYTKTRVQFGQAIAGFQALRHRMADLHVLVESARSLSRAAAASSAAAAASSAAAAASSAAASAFAGADAGLGPRAAAVKVYCSEALMRTAGEMIQLHGAIGVTWEHQAHHYLKRAHGSRHLFGGPAQHAAAIAACLLDH